MQKIPLMEHKESGKEFFTLRGNAGGYQDIEQSDIEDKKIEDPEAFFMEQLNAKGLYKERVECHKIHGTMPGGIRAFSSFPQKRSVTSLELKKKTVKAFR